MVKTILCVHPQGVSSPLRWVPSIPRPHVRLDGTSRQEGQKAKLSWVSAKDGWNKRCVAHFAHRVTARPQPGGEEPLLVWAGYEFPSKEAQK